MTYDQWRITYQSGNQAAQAAWVELCKVTKERDELLVHCKAKDKDIDYAIDILTKIYDSGVKLDVQDDASAHNLLVNYKFAKSPKQRDEK